MTTHLPLAIECQQLSYQIQDKTLLDNISTEFPTAQITVILGNNGAGKSTLLGCLSKELTPSNGQIIWQNTPLKNLNFSVLAQQRSVLPQLDSMVFSLSVQELIRLGANVQIYTDTTSVNKTVQEVMRMCDIEHLASRDVMTLSGGEQKRVHLARVIAQIWPADYFDSPPEHPFLGRWLLLDEWTNSLDLHHQQSLAKTLTQLAKKGLGVVMVLHDINLCAQIADKVILLNQAQLVQQGSVNQVLTSETIEKYLGLAVKVINVDEIQHPVILPIETTDS